MENLIPGRRMHVLAMDIRHSSLADIDFSSDESHELLSDLNHILDEGGYGGLSSAHTKEEKELLEISFDFVEKRVDEISPESVLEFTAQGLVLWFRSRDMTDAELSGVSLTTHWLGTGKDPDTTDVTSRFTELISNPA